MFRSLAAGAVLLLGPHGAGWLQAATAAPPTSIDRIIATVTINGQGPLRFMLDTGATQAVIAQSAVRRLGLRPEPGRRIEVLGINGRVSAAAVHIDSLESGALQFRNLDMAVLSGPVFDGLDGILGIDGLRDMSLTVDFLRQRCVISAARPQRLSAFAVVPLHIRSLRLPMVAGRVGNIGVQVIVDTGAAHTLGNPALLAALRRAGELQASRAAPPVIDATAMAQDGDVVSTPALRLGNVTLSGLGVTFGDYPIFGIWGLSGQPAVLLGMDALGTLAWFSIDYPHLELRLLPRS